MRTPEGHAVGEHQGLMYYTLGQRQGLGIGGSAGGDGSPWYVAAKDLASNTLVVVQGHDHPLLLKKELTAGDLHWIAGEAPPPGRYGAKTRYRQPDAACEISYPDAGSMRVVFDLPQWAPTPGQYLVLYDADVCLGGGVIQ
jgi:tRNA-specific 2-thiouridylase